MATLVISGSRGYYGPMDSGLYTKVFTSTEVIAASLFLILLLPLVFFIASTKSRRRFSQPSPRVRRARRPAAAERMTSLDEGAEVPRGRRAESSQPEEDEPPEGDERR